MSDDQGKPISSASISKDWKDVMMEAVDGGLLRLLVGKPVQQALGRLVSGAADVPAAYLDSWAQRIKNDTRAKKRIEDALADEAKKLAIGDDGLVKAGLDRWTNKFKARQRSVDEVAMRTIGVLAEEPIPAEAAAPQEDFMRMFEDMAERASSENVADLLARILAGEIRKPRSISLRTLQIVSIVDQEIISAFSEVAPFFLDGGWIHIPPSAYQKWGEIFSLLSSVSIAGLPKSFIVQSDTDKTGWHQGKKGVVVSSTRFIHFGLAITVSHLTPIGREIFSVMPLREKSKIQEIALGFKEISEISEVMVGDTIEKDDKFYIGNTVSI